MVLSYLKQLVTRHENKKSILVLGYYNRHNLGDEAYRITIPMLLGNQYNYTFACTDDIDDIPNNTDIIICGGGDIINEYFMKKINHLIHNFSGPIYALSVGISYKSDIEYLKIFDHVFVRSKFDYILASEEIGKKNVTYIDDITTKLCECKVKDVNQLLKLTPASKSFKIGFCLANPMIYDNPAKKSIISQVQNVIKHLLNSQRDILIYLLAFNSDDNDTESDVFINSQIHSAIDDDRIHNLDLQSLRDPVTMINLIKSLDLTVCMRYHSALFSLLMSTKCIILNVSPKINKLVYDLSLQSCAINVSLDKFGYPVDLNTEKLIQLIHKFEFCSGSKMDFYHDRQEKLVNEYLSKGKLKNILIKNNINSLEHAYFNVKRIITQYAKIDEDYYEKILHKTGSLKISNVKTNDLATLICYAITGQVNHTCLWGLQQNLNKTDFKLFEAINFIYNYFYKDDTVSERYYPTINFERKIFINLDFIFQIDTNFCHRSGWTYVLGGMMNIDGPRFGRKSNLLVDTYIDRSFHWGHDILKSINIIPYTKSWIGFIHHTFNTSSQNNNVNLFNKPTFIESLSTCKGLIALSRHLALQIKQKLIQINLQNIKVYHLDHPMERVTEEFSMSKWNLNINKKIVQIGAWLRDPYAIYKLPLTAYKNPLNVQKCVLKGKNMSGYFKPEHLHNNLKNLLVQDNSDVYQIQQRSLENSENELYHPIEPFTNFKFEPHDNISRVPDISRSFPVSRPIPLSRPVLKPNSINDSRPNDLSRPDEKDIFINKYCEGLYNNVIDQEKTVKIIDTLSNRDYDILLGKNIVFLNLIDASAVNTVLECFMRNTPLICNRLPAVEEVLGKTYPGFYKNLYQAVDMINDNNKIAEIHFYLKRKDKSRFLLDNFIQSFQNIVLAINI